MEPHLKIQKTSIVTADAVDCVDCLYFR